MSEDKIPETMQAVQDRVLLMKHRGFAVTEEQVIGQSVKDGLQAIVNDLLDGEYFTVQLIDQKNFAIIGIAGKQEGHITAKGDSFLSDFKKNPDLLWDYLWDQAEKVIGR
ncbi:hypothetical protein [Oenococcus sicerae]|uniref:hypothetical protein n=1 Tax=Oenococcus sicerae TaxID=2203724 RepID=UPI0010B4A446|nr:hypothetical protein OAL24_00612 [Oenococcus sicerae]